MFPPVGLIGIAVTVLYALVSISIKQAIKGKKPILDMFREGTKTCRKCKQTFAKKEHWTCPHCARVRELYEAMKLELGKFMISTTNETEEAEFYDYFCDKYV